MKVQNMTGRTGRSVPNQFVISGIEQQYIGGEAFDTDVEYFQSYNSIIVKRWFDVNRWRVELDRFYWDYSVTTGKYRNQFLGETKAETQRKIDSGEYILTDLNG